VIKLLKRALIVNIRGYHIATIGAIGYSSQTL